MTRNAKALLLLGAILLTLLALSACGGGDFTAEDPDGMSAAEASARRGTQPVDCASHPEQCI